MKLKALEKKNPRYTVYLPQQRLDKTARSFSNPPVCVFFSAALHLICFSVRTRHELCPVFSQIRCGCSLPKCLQIHKDLPLSHPVRQRASLCFRVSGVANRLRPRYFPVLLRRVQPSDKRMRHCKELTCM